MTKSTLKKFGDMEFIQGIDKPRFMVSLLQPYSTYFSGLGLDQAPSVTTMARIADCLRHSHQAGTSFPMGS